MMIGSRRRPKRSKRCKRVPTGEGKTSLMELAESGGGDCNGGERNESGAGDDYVRSTVHLILESLHSVPSSRRQARYRPRSFILSIAQKRENDDRQAR